MLNVIKEKQTEKEEIAKLLKKCNHNKNVFCILLSFSIIVCEWRFLCVLYFINVVECLCVFVNKIRDK